MPATDPQPRRPDYSDELLMLLAEDMRLRNELRDRDPDAVRELRIEILKREIEELRSRLRC